MILGVALVTLGALMAQGQTALFVGAVLALTTWFFAGLFLWILSQAQVPDTDLAVAVGEPLPAFEALDTQGNPWSSEALQGQRTLLKFYRGAWCPYCTAELQRFERMRPQLDAHGVQVVALSRDTPPESAAYAQREHLSCTLLCDPGLDAIEQFGVLHQRGVRFETFTLAGIPVGMPVGYDHMAVPTTLLVDEAGVIRWIDQAQDYRLRGDEARIEQALAEAFPA
jgi:peroxiredoxin